jgi:hypothetical protein
VTISSSGTSMKKIEEIEPEPEIQQKLSPKVTSARNTKGQSNGVGSTEKVEDI